MVNTSDDLEALREKIANYLTEAGVDYRTGADGHFAVREGTAAVLIFPVPWEGERGERYTLVQLISPVALDITRYDQELTKFLSEENHKLVFGKFSLDTDHATIWLGHVLIGDFLDKRELIVSYQMVARTADQYDEIIAGLAGGKRAIDVAREYPDEL